jgi:hypothetical protein
MRPVRFSILRLGSGRSAPIKLEVAVGTGRSAKHAWMRFVGRNSRINQLGWLVPATILICASARAGENCNYLAVIGPAAVRFSVAMPQYDPAKVLPPLKMSDAPAANLVENVTRPVEQVAPQPVETKTNAQEQTSASEVTPPAASVESTPAPIVMPAEPKAEASQMTPQMLLRYFNREGTKEVIVPNAVEFTPPAPASTGRSSAVYSSPAAK